MSIDSDMKKKTPLKTYNRQVKKRIKTAKARTRSHAGRGTQTPGTKMLYNGTLH